MQTYKIFFYQQNSLLVRGSLSGRDVSEFQQLGFVTFFEGKAVIKVIFASNC